MRTRNRWRAFGAALAVLDAAPSAASTIRDSAGIAVHHATPRDLVAAKTLGVKLLRTDLGWQSTEKAPGVYSNRSFVQLAQQAQAAGIRMMFILDYGNPLYSPNTITARDGVLGVHPRAPDAAASQDAYARWAAFNAAALKAYRPIFEIWNEPDVDHFWPPKPDPQAYGSLAGQACRAIKHADPAAEVIGPGLADPDNVIRTSSSWLEPLARSSAPACLTAFSVHAYRHQGDSGHDLPDWSAIRAGSKRAGGGGELVDSEHGVSVAGAVTDRDQASYMIKMFVINAVAHVKYTIWYSLRDEPNEADPAKRGFGLFSIDYQAKPAALAMQLMMDRVGDLQLAGFCEQPGGLAVARFTGSALGDDYLIAWMNGRKQARPVPGAWRPMEIIDMTNGTSKSVALSNYPVLVRVKHASSLSCVQLTAGK